MAGGVAWDEEQQHREASSDASLWEDVDDIDTSFDGITTPPLPQHLPLPPQPGPNPLLATASHPIAITDSAPESSTLHHGLELDLFPSEHSSVTSRSNQPHPPSSFDLDASAAATEPWSQPDMNNTQYLRDEWLISVGQKQPNDLVDDFVPRKDANMLEPPRHSLRTPAKGSDTASDLELRSADRAKVDAAGRASMAKRGRSSLLDQLDAICSSPSQHFSSSPNANEHPTIQRSPATERQPFQPVNSVVSNAQEPPPLPSPHESENEELSAIDMLEMSCSPPSQPFPHMKLIKDMPQDLQNLYHRLAFGGSSSASSTPTNPGTTARGTRGKTWQTTWQDGQDGAADTSSRSSSARAGATAATSVGSTRGRKTTSTTATTTARKGTRGAKTRSSFANSTTSSRNRSQYFASWRGRGRGRPRGRGRGR